MGTRNMNADDDTAVGPWERAAILRRIDADGIGLNDAQKDVVVRAIRNPDSPIKRVADFEDTAPVTLRNAFTRVKHGGFDVDDDYDDRLDEGGESFLSCTIKQRAAIDCLARYPDLLDAFTVDEMALFVAEDTGVPLHFSTVYEMRKNKPATVSMRRDRLDDDEVQDLGDRRDDHRGNPVPVREFLTDAGVTVLPERNVDDLPTAEQVRRDMRNASSEVLRNVREDGDSGDGGDIGDGGDGGGETVTVDAGNSRYEGPAEGIDTTSGNAPSHIGSRASASDEADETPASDAFDAIRDAEGEFGEHAYQRDVSVDSVEELENELHRLRMVVSGQGSMIKALRDALDNIEVSVDVHYDADVGGDGGGSE